MSRQPPRVALGPNQVTSLGRIISGRSNRPFIVLAFSTYNPEKQMGFLRRKFSFLGGGTPNRPNATSTRSALASVNEVQEQAAPQPQPQSPPQQSRNVLKKPPDPAQTVTAENIRELRELIRHRYALDMEIWEARHYGEYERDFLKQNMRKSDATLRSIRATLEAWNHRELFQTDDEFAKFQSIRTRLMTGDKKDWHKNPPWEHKEEPIEPLQAPPYELDRQRTVYEKRYSDTNGVMPNGTAVGDTRHHNRLSLGVHRQQGGPPHGSHQWGRDFGGHRRMFSG